MSDQSRSLSSASATEGGSDPARGLPTLETVAAQAGVSRSTVSRVVNGSPKVRPDVVDAVNATIARMNYVPNRAARSLASRQTYAIALLVPEETTRFFGDPYFAAIVKGITARLEPTDYILNLLVASSDPTRKTRRFLRSGSVDGALVVSHHASDRDLTELNEAVPMVFGGRPAAQALSNSYYVDVDNLDGSRQATQHLIERGARRIATITGPPDMPASIDRLAGWRQVMAGAGMAGDAVADGDFTGPGAASAMGTLLDRHPDLDAVFAASDLMARGALEVLVARGRAVPGDVAVVGFDDSPAATAGELHLTTMRQPSETMGLQMAEMLLELLAGRIPESPSILPTDLIIRDTA
ncbi:MAG TPA: LacI family DNA-binding transcriptional regulator [Microlunatus sp.]